MHKKLKVFIGLLVSILIVFSLFNTINAEAVMMSPFSNPSDDFEFIGYDSNEFPFVFDILDYADGEARISVTPKMGYISDSDMSISLNDETVDGDEIVSITNGTFKVRVNSYYAFSTSYYAGDVNTYYHCNIMAVFIDRPQDTKSLYVYVRDIATAVNYEEADYYNNQSHSQIQAMIASPIPSPAEAVNFLWEKYNIVTETTYTQGSWPTNGTVSAGATWTGYTLYDFSVTNGFSSAGQKKTVSPSSPGGGIYYQQQDFCNSEDCNWRQNSYSNVYCYNKNR